MPGEVSYVQLKAANPNDNATRNVFKCVAFSFLTHFFKTQMVTDLQRYGIWSSGPLLPFSKNVLKTRTSWRGALGVRPRYVPRDSGACRPTRRGNLAFYSFYNRKRGDVRNIYNPARFAVIKHVHKLHWNINDHTHDPGTPSYYPRQRPIPGTIDPRQTPLSPPRRHNWHDRRPAVYTCSRIPRPCLRSSGRPTVV